MQRAHSDDPSRNSRDSSSRSSRSGDLLRRAAPSPLQPLQSPLLTGRSPPHSEVEPCSPLRLSAVAPLGDMSRDSSGASGTDTNTNTSYSRPPLLQPLNPSTELSNTSRNEQQSFGYRSSSREWSRPKNLSFDSNGSDVSGTILAESINEPSPATVPPEKRFNDPLNDLSDDAWSDSDDSSMVEAGGEGDSSPMHRSSGSRSCGNEETRRSSENSNFNSEDVSEVRAVFDLFSVSTS